MTAAAALVAGAVPAQAQRPSQGEDESASLVDEGRAALRKGRLDDAAKALDQAIALNPRRVEAYVLRSAVYAARKEYAAGVALMRRAEALAPTDADVLTALGSQLVLSGDVATGVPLLQQVTTRDPNRYDAQLLLGHHFHDVPGGKWPEAIAAFEAYFAHRPSELAAEDARHRVDLADAYLRSHRPEKALALFQQAFAEKKPRGDLRAQIGIAWATAALDCRKARPLLRELEPVAETHPDIWLVDGQCALALGDPAAGLAQGRRYLDKVDKGSAAGHALVGEALAARGNLGDAKKELELARDLEPARRRWPVRLAIVLRRANDHAGALATLEKLGAPAQAAQDPDWWTELGEVLLAKGDAKAAAARLAPVAAELATEAPLHVVLGAAQLATNQPELAVKTLSEPESVAATPRGKKLLVDALTTVAAHALATGDAAAAEPLLVRADALDGNPVVWRNLGIARLVANKPADAVTALDRAAKADPSPITLMLDARAHALAGDIAGARPIYEKAIAALTTVATPMDRDAVNLEIAIDWAASELAGGDPALAVTMLEKTQAAAQRAAAGPKTSDGAKIAQRYKAAFAEVRHAAGVAALRTGNGMRAIELLRAAAAADPSLATRCDLALAAVVTGDAGAALGALKAITGQSCPFPPPADTQAAPILAAFTEGLTPKRAAGSLARLTSLSGKSSGAAAVLLGVSMRVIALEAAADAFRSGQFAQARKFLATARTANARVGLDEIAHDLAVLDLVEGRTDAAIAQLEKLIGKVPETLVNLGIAYDKKGEPQKALDAWRKARKAGVRYAPLQEWIESKERVYGEVP